MIASLKGQLIFKAPESTIVEVGGVGYKVALSNQSFSKLPSLGQNVFLFIHTSVREDDISLFGFLDEEEKRAFQKLISVNGIGPKLALTILSGINTRDLASAIRREDIVRLTAISGIGKKTAERMILDLKDKLDDLLITDLTALEKGDKPRLFDEALSALVNLGYTRLVAEKTLSQIPLTGEIPLEGVIRHALKHLSVSN